MAELQKVQAQLDQLHKHGGTVEVLGKLQGAIGELQRKLGAIHGNAGERQRAIGAKQGELGARQGKLGEQQGKPGEQQSRLVKSYKANAAKTGLEETTITRLRYLLTDQTRQPMPAGGLFSTASDLARFCLMILNGGVLDGKRYLSETAVKRMTSKQAPDALTEKCALGWSTSDGEFGHGGAYATNMTIDPQHGLVFVWMVQHAGFPGDGAKS